MMLGVSTDKYWELPSLVLMLINQPTNAVLIPGSISQYRHAINVKLYDTTQSLTDARFLNRGVTPG